MTEPSKLARRAPESVKSLRAAWNFAAFGQRNFLRGGFPSPLTANREGGIFKTPARAKTRSRISRKDSPTPLPRRAKIKNRRGNFLLRKIPAFRARKKPAPSGQPAKKSRRLHCGGVFFRNELKSDGFQLCKQSVFRRHSGRPEALGIFEKYYGRNLVDAVFLRNVRRFVHIELAY